MTRFTASLAHTVTRVEGAGGETLRLSRIYNVFI